MNKIEKTTVCIIGAGPSGAATSIQLSKLKIPHYIIDKSTFPRDKTCGDGLILYAFKAMKFLGDDLFASFLKHPKFIHSKKISLHLNNTSKIVFKESDDRSMIISYAKRIDFDQFLVSYLSDVYANQQFGSGVKEIREVPEGVFIKLKNGKEIVSQFVVGADGAKSIVASKLAKTKVDKKLASTFVSAYYKGVKDLPTGNAAEVRMVYKKMLLFFYVFPLSDGQVNISLGGRSDHIKKYGVNLVDEIQNIIKNHKKVKNKFKNATKVNNWRGWSIPFHFGNHKTSGDRFLLVGDAAGLANAFYKEGIGTGMMSGIIAAKNIDRCLKNDDFSESSLKKYDEDLKKEFGKLLKFSYFALKVARFKYFFLAMTGLLHKKIESKAHKIIEKRSY
ncbi:NAD(P)/FAD-dependent oxidoreductase [Polaribacter sp. AHE13PA]|uniref:NAD(P)/FAD-dependent oxidoreductase n=1 Tax=Polaribacter sp. AHE13PA TaxID=2745562 RepID=UPI001C4F29E2|nr:NAD(P)/FAD-dependent oxidoreductase [Polaribacter sp. AHE13PA]QXP68129.1 NAD(P)/FAD-dependent oxidoreductase [Polaribacter sp. AHE13PA]